MKKLYSFIIIAVLCIESLAGQEMDAVFTGTYSGTLTQAGRNSIILGNGYTYSPGGGTLTVEIQNPVVTGNVSYSAQPVDPETREINTSFFVGAIPGSFSLNPAGASSYTIPLELLPGVNGLAPNLYLSYSSNNGPGIAGYGWQIGGLSFISRGPQTYYNDGAARGVELDNLDRFYLDGQRLVTTNSSTYGDANAQYQTDNDIFTRVVPQATDANGPGWFKAETKSGLIYEYGNNTGSKQKIPGFNQTVNWYVSSIKDRFDNPNNIYFSYFQDNNSVYLGEIAYGLNATNTITLYYKQRQDVITNYLKGAKIQQGLILDRITIKYNSTVVRSYELKYTYEGPLYNFYSNLNEIIEYGTGTSRYNSTALSYQLPTTVSINPPAPTINHQYVSSTSRLITGDYNGDGKADFLCIPNDGSWTGLRIYYSDGNNYFTSYASETTSLIAATDIRAIDLNGDGKDDILYETISGNTAYFNYMLNDGTPFTAPYSIRSLTKSSLTGLCGRSRRVIEYQYDDNEEYTKPKLTRHKINSSPDNADYNGDGVNDIFINSNSGNWYIYSFVNSSGNLTSGLNLLASGTISTLNNEVLGGDFNGDGKSEIWSFNTTGVKIYSFSGSALSQIYSSSWPSTSNYFNLGDFNADGKVDMFLYGSGRNGTPLDWTTWQIQLSTGAGFEGYDFPQKKPNLKNNYVRLADFNGDGATDIMAIPGKDETSGVRAYISMNKGTDFYTYNFNNDNSYMSYNIYIADYDGDGRSDLALTSAPLWWAKFCTDCQVTPSPGYGITRQNGNTTTLLAKVGDGLGALTKISYAKLSQPVSGLYNRGSGAVYPASNFQGPMTVVSSIQVDNGKGTLNTRNYQYEGAIIHLQGKGLLGYSKISATDQTSGISNESTISGYNSSYFYPLVTRTFSRINADTINVVKETWSHILFDASKKRIFPYTRVTQQTDKLTGHSVTVNNYTVDNYGTPVKVIKTYSNGPTETTINSINNTVSSSQWLLGRPTATTIQYSEGGNIITRTGTRIFSTTNNNLTSETWHSGTNLQIVKGFAYNPNGTLSSETMTANSQSRTTSYTYCTDYIRIATVTDPLGHLTTNTYDSYGRLYTKKDYLNNIETFLYDNMGRESVVSSTFGDQTSVSFAWEEEIVPSNLKRRYYSIQKTGNDGSVTREKYDNLGRVVRAENKGFNGTMIYTATVYNLKSQVESISEPYYSNDSPLLNNYQYDNYGRKTSLTRPSGRNSTWSYTSNTGIIIETTAGKTFSKTYSSNGTLTSASDAGGTISYTYYPDGKIKIITAPGGFVTSMQYDIAGNQTQLVDQSAGTVNYTYNGFGELLSQQNARLQTTTITYNSNGTIATKTYPEGTPITYSYNYNSNKQLTGITSTTGVSRMFGYDTKGRISSVTETIPGSSNFVTSYNYDSYGRLSTITHPSSIIETKVYNSNGYLWHTDADGTVRWTNTSMNARRQITAGQYGSSPGLSATFGYDNYGFPTSIATGSLQNFKYRFDPVTGNLISRRINGTDLRDSVTYDNLDRIDYIYKRKTTPVRIFNMEYDSNKGSIINKDDVGTLNYNVSVKPYALNNVNPSTGLLPSAIDSLTYTSFESVNTISESPYSASFIYNSDEERAKMEVSQSGSVILSRWYTSSGYIKEISAGVTKEYTFIGGDAYTAPVLAIKQNGSAPTWYYLLRDHLGSITHVVNASNNTTLYEYNYDAWGRMRDPTTWEPYAPSQIAQSNPFVAGRGFTGHEHLPWFNMINMNGRLYDPLTGQFLSPDNNVQLPDFTQNLNRYTYCLNNPLKYTDPDGEWVITALTMLANMYVSTSAANGWQFNPAKWDWRNVKTWSSLVQSGISGYNMGSSAENFVKEKAFDFRMNRAINDKSIQTNPDGSLIKSDETLYDFSRQYFKRFKYRNNIPLRYDNSINTDGITYGVTLWDPVGLKPVCSFSDIAFSSKKALFLTMGHEYIHATHYLLRFPSSSLGDYAAFSWEALVSSKAGDMKWAGDATLLASNNIHWYNRIFNSQYKWKVWEYTPDLGIPLIMPNF